MIGHGFPYHFFSYNFLAIYIYTFKNRNSLISFTGIFKIVQTASVNISFQISIFIIIVISLKWYILIVEIHFNYRNIKCILILKNSDIVPFALYLSPATT